MVVWMSRLVDGADERIWRTLGMSVRVTEEKEYKIVEGNRTVVLRGR